MEPNQLNDEKQTIPSVQPDLQTPLIPQFTNPPAKKSNKIIFIVVFVVLFSLVGLTVFGLTRDKKDQATKTENTKIVSEETTLNNIKVALGKMGNRGEIDSPRVVNSSREVYFIASFGYSFNASLYATDTSLAPIGTQDPKGSGVEQALDRDAVDKIMKDAGLSSVYSDTPTGKYNVKDLTIYESKLVLCNVTDSLGLATVKCTGAKSVKKVTDAFEAAKAILIKDNPKIVFASPSNYGMSRFTESSDGSVQSIAMEVNISGTDKYMATAYLVEVDNSWKYLASDTYEDDVPGPELPSCSILANPDYKGVFDYVNDSRADKCE